MKIDWTPPVSTSTVFTPEQKQRVQALRVAAEIAVHFKTSTGFAQTKPWEPDETMAFLLSLGDWIIDPSTINHDLLEHGLSVMLAAEQEKNDG